MSSEKSGCGARIGMILLLIIVGILVYFLIIKPNLKQQKITFSGIKNEILNRKPAASTDADKKTPGAEKNSSESVNAENNSSTAGNNEIQVVQPQAEDSAERSDPAVESWY